MNDLALGYRSAGKFDLALPLFDETYRRMNAKFGPDHPYTLVSMNNLALGYRSAGKIDLALSLHKKTLSLFMVKFGPDHPYTLTGMGNLAGGYRDAGKVDLALPLFEESFKGLHVKLGSDHPTTLNSMNDLAVCYWRLRQLNKSILLFEELLLLREKQSGREHPATLMVIANLGVNYRDAGRLAEALPLLEEAYTSSKKHVSLHWVGNELLDAYVTAGKTNKAKKLIDELLADARKSMPKESLNLVGLLYVTGVSLMELKEFTDAEPPLRECLAIGEKIQHESWANFNVQSLLGGALLGQKKYTDAEPLLVKGYEGMKAREKAIPPQGRSRIPEALDRLIELYTATNKPEEAKKFRALREKHPTSREVAPPPNEKK